MRRLLTCSLLAALFIGLAPEGANARGRKKSKKSKKMQSDGPSPRPHCHCDQLAPQSANWHWQLNAQMNPVCVNFLGADQAL